jgi:hypothetical protein
MVYQLGQNGTRAIRFNNVKILPIKIRSFKIKSLHATNGHTKLHVENNRR